MVCGHATRAYLMPKNTCIDTRTTIRQIAKALGKGLRGKIVRHSMYRYLSPAATNMLMAGKAIKMIGKYPLPITAGLLIAAAKMHRTMKIRSI